MPFTYEHHPHTSRTKKRTMLAKFIKDHTNKPKGTVCKLNASVFVALRDRGIVEYHEAEQKAEEPKEIKEVKPRKPRTKKNG